VYGLGGVGKSELALQYAIRYTDRYALVWWATADDLDALQASLAGLARRLEPAHSLLGTTNADAADWATQWLQCHSGWMLILDNVEDRSTVASLLAQVSRHGQIIITTRRDFRWRGTVHPVPLNVLTADAGVALLSGLTGRVEEATDLEKLANELGFLPLALEQAGAYIAEQRITVARYMDLLRGKPGRAFKSVDQGGESLRTISRVWNVTLSAIRDTNKTAAFLLEVMAYLAPNSIPRHYLILGSTSAGVHSGAGRELRV